MKKTKKGKSLQPVNENQKPQEREPKLLLVLMRLNKWFDNTVRPGEYKGPLDHLVASLVYLGGCIIYLIGLYSPNLYKINGPVKTIDMFSNGYLLLLVISFSGLVCVLGLILKKNFYQILALTALFFFILHFSTHIRLILSNPTSSTGTDILGIGYYFTFFGSVMVICGSIYFWPIIQKKIDASITIHKMSYKLGKGVRFREIKKSLKKLFFKANLFILAGSIIYLVNFIFLPYIFLEGGAPIPLIRMFNFGLWFLPVMSFAVILCFYSLVSRKVFPLTLLLLHLICLSEIVGWAFYTNPHPQVLLGDTFYFGIGYFILFLGECSTAYGLGTLLFLKYYTPTFRKV
ncbi:MAG: hypothetical protein NT166_32270 [Candidatus Aminicenantes bacterium]|nr:hypothetical protein [Candidatus Aminicenantes bacterium]